MTKTNNKGFSLVELIIVIAIMAVLVGILAPQFVRYVEESRESTDIKNVQEITTAIQVWAADPDGAIIADGTTLTLDGTAATTGSDLEAALNNAGLPTGYDCGSNTYAAAILTINNASGTLTFDVGITGDEESFSDEFGF